MAHEKTIFACDIFQNPGNLSQALVRIFSQRKVEFTLIFQSFSFQDQSLTMHQSTTPSLSQTIWPGCRYETIEEIKEAVMKMIDTLTQEDFHGAFQKLLERYNKCTSAGGDYFEGD